ncbi:MAG: peptidase inhibitor family I36 protein [Labilithrix sp.]|nr:peptidase inhibitor family I36 protein [Labilithrix sp.]
MGCAAEDVEEEEEQGETSSALASSCSAGYACIYQHSKFGGRLLQFRDGGCQNLGGKYNFNDRASSIRNRTGRTLRLYKDANCKGSTRTFGPGEQTQSLGGFGDEASSIRIF